MAVYDGKHNINSIRREVPVGCELDVLDKYVVHDDEERDFNTTIWKLIAGFPIIIVVWKEEGKPLDDKNMHLIKGASELRAIKEFIDGRIAHIIGQEVSWDNFSQHEKDYLMGNRTMIDILIQCDNEVGNEISNII